MDYSLLHGSLPIEVFWTICPVVIAILLSFRALWPVRFPQTKISPLAKRTPLSETGLADKPSESTRRKQRWDAFLVLDVEGTCEQGTTFAYPNEIIEWPVILLRWADKQSDGTTSKLEIVDEFRTFVKPTWRPQLTEFCTSLTGITQEQVDQAPTFPEAMEKCASWLTRHGLIDPDTGRRAERFCWCTDGPWDLRDFLVKQLFISKMAMPPFLEGTILDVRHAVDVARGISAAYGSVSQRRALSLERQLHLLGLPPFEGRQHSGIDDARNIARVLQALAEGGSELVPTLDVNPRRRWPWMGKKGRILEENIQTNLASSDRINTELPTSDLHAALTPKG